MQKCSFYVSLMSRRWRNVSCSSFSLSSTELIIAHSSSHCIIKSYELKVIVWMWMYVFFSKTRPRLKLQKIRVKDRNCKTHHFIHSPAVYWIAHTNWLFFSCWIASICCVFMINTVCNAHVHIISSIFIMNHKILLRNFSKP